MSAEREENNLPKDNTSDVEEGEISEEKSLTSNSKVSTHNEIR